MKAAFINTVTELMDNDENIIVITADYGFSVFENLQEKYPTRVINTGVTEQASVGVAAGLAMSGFKVIFYAQAAFATMRCFEQLHLDVAYGNQNITVVGVNAGVSLCQLGVSHFSVEDVGIVRTLPNMTIFTPGNAYEMQWALKEANRLKGPSYLRYAKLQDSDAKKSRLSLGKPVLVSPGEDATLIVSGGIISMGKQAVELLKGKNIHIALYSMPTIKPIDKKKLLAVGAGKKAVFTLEEHSIIGGLGSAVSEIYAETPNTPPVYRMGIPDQFTSVTGSIDYLLSINGLSAPKIAKEIIKRI